MTDKLYMGLLFSDHYRQDWKDVLQSLILFDPGESNAQTVHPYLEQAVIDPMLLHSDLSSAVTKFRSELDITTLAADEPQKSYFEACAKIRGNFKATGRVRSCLKVVKGNVLKEMMDFCCSDLVNVCTKKRCCSCI
jgi:hypothetical protein